ncbi:putative secreted protein [Maribacter sp. HTCC2170]|nr:putative secreted protein [Maribacter sp. HTCC2170]
MAWSQNLGDSYIVAWSQFHPSKALSEGIRTAVFDYEDLSQEKISNWVEYNQKILGKLSSPNNAKSIDPIDARLLRVQVSSEIDNWTKLSLHASSLTLYSRLIAHSIEPVLQADYLLSNEKSSLICKCLTAVRHLSDAAISNLKQVTKNDLENGKQDLRLALDFYKNDLPKLVENDRSIQKCDGFTEILSRTMASLEKLVAFVASELQKNIRNVDDNIGRDEYARRLKLYTDSPLSPEELSKMALKEIEIVRGLMANVSKVYLAMEYPNRSIPKKYDELTGAALADMEKDAPLNGADYLQFWNDLSNKALLFIKENKIATLPKNQTLRILPAPESAGPAARIGWVASAPPFEPNPLTTLYLPSIPDTLPVLEQKEFWASFNRPFNRMIVIHELFPGHYMQLKISRETPHPIRLLFPYGIYTEGWATFTEKVLLDAGWEADNHLTLLAHLRKRLENANRAYTSVQVHCNGWNQEQVLQFSTETSLLAPQFAKSLWGRIMKSPMQLTSYFLGGAKFTSLLQSEKERLGNSFDLQLFMDTIMISGPIPIDEFHELFAKISPN